MMLARKPSVAYSAAAVAAVFTLFAACDLVMPPRGEDSLSFEPADITLHAVEGRTDPVRQTVGLHFDGAGTVSWSATCDQPWLTVSPPTGSMCSTATMSLRIAAASAGLSAGLYEGTVTAAAVAGEVRPAVLAVELEITPPGGPTGPATVTKQPADQVVSEREDAVFTVAATGQEPVTYQWRRDGKDIPCATKPSYTCFSARLDADGTQFTCVVSNTLGSETSAPATLTVNMARPVFYEQPHDLAVTAGAPAEFSVSAAGSGTVQYKWQRVDLEIPGATSDIYALPSAGVGDSGAVFTCVVSNEAGSVTSRAATLTVSNLAILTPALPGALVGPDYWFPLMGEGGVGPYTWTVRSGTLPTGLMLDPTGDYIYGYPTALETQTITIEMQDSGANPLSLTKDFTITVHEPAIQIGILPIDYTLDYIWGEPGKALTVTLTATGGRAPYTWNVELGTLPDGLTLDPGTGAISGTPARGGFWRALVQVTDALDRSNLATVTFSINPLGPDMPRLMSVDQFTDSDGINRMAFTTWSASSMQSVTVDALFMNSNYPTRLEAFSPPTTPEFAAMTPGLDEEIWEIPALDGGVYLSRRTLTDDQGRTTVVAAGPFHALSGPGGETWPIHDSDGDGVPDSCDTVAGDDPSDSLEIHRDVVLRALGPAEDVSPPELTPPSEFLCGVPGAQSARLMFSLSDESFIAGGEVYVGFTGPSSLEMVAVPLAFRCIAQVDPDFLKGFPGGERWALPYIPCDYEIHGARFWDCHGNTLEWGMGDVAYYLAQSTTPVPNIDTDVDNIDDGWETTYFASVANCNPGEDPDGDGYTNMDEYLFRSDPTDAASVPVTHDSDLDGVPDVFDPDDPTSYVSLHAPLPKSVLKNYDSDSDGMPDIWESCHALDPSSPADAAGDPDGDGLVNLDEFLRGDDPYDTDSDDDGTADATDNETGSFVESSLPSADSVYTPTGLVATRTQVSASEQRYDGTCHVAATFSSFYPLAWVKVKVRLYPTDEIILVDATKVADPSIYDMWWVTDHEVWATPPVRDFLGEDYYFEPSGFFACDTHGRVTGY